MFEAANILEDLTAKNREQDDGPKVDGVARRGFTVDDEGEMKATGGRRVGIETLIRGRGLGQKSREG